jgi:O-acetyl-ADP-ribose deacetylase (regulator of RNase III)
MRRPLVDPQGDPAVVFVVDRSTSVGEAGLRSARTAIGDAVAALGADARVGLVAFDAGVQVVQPLASVRTDGGRVVKAAWALRNVHGSALHAGWVEGLTQALAGPRAGAAPSDAEPPVQVVVFTDGVADVGVKDPAELLADVGVTDPAELLADVAGARAAAGVATSFVAVGAKPDRSLLRALAGAGGGAYVEDAPDPGGRAPAAGRPRLPDAPDDPAPRWVARAGAGPARVDVVVGDVTEEAVDALVNSTNRGLFGTGGVDGEVHRKGGPRLTDACRRLGELEYGRAVVTPGFRLRARHVVHVSVPPWQGGERGELRVLEEAYRAALDVARRLRATSIALPAVGTGTYRYPVAAATRVAMGTVLDELARFGGPERVRFVLADDATANAYRAARIGG